LAVVGERVEIGASVIIEPFGVVDDDVKIGCGSILRSGTRVYSRVDMGEETVVVQIQSSGIRGMDSCETNAATKRGFLISAE